MNTFNKLILAVSVAASFAASATSGNNVQQQIDDLRAGLHDVHMNTLQKYSESWGLEDRANIAKLQESKVDKSLFAADQARQDKALAETVTKQAATDAKQTSDLKSYADKKATSAYQTAVAHTDAKVARADADRLKGDNALQGQIDTNTANQSVRDAGQDDHINAVQGAAQTANDRATNLEVRADATEQSLSVTDDRSISNAVRLDGAEQGIRDVQASSQTANDRATRLEGRADATDKVTAQHSSDIQALYGESSYSASRIDVANANIQANRNAITSTNKVVAEHSATLANHEQRIGDLEQNTNRNFAGLRDQVEKNRKRAEAGTSAALASAAIPQVTGEQRFSLGAGVGGYESENALAVGFSSRVTSNVVLKASVTTDTQHGFGYNVGASVGW